MRARFPRYAVPAAALTVLAALLAALLGAPPSDGAGPTRLSTWTVAPGVTYSQSDFTTPGGPQRIHVLDIDPTVPGVSLGYVAGASLRDKSPTSTLVASEHHTVAGVNGNFFDIGDTNAPLGIGKSRARGLLHAPLSGWNNAFYETRDGVYHVGPLALTAHIVEQPTWQVGGLNTPHARPGSITMYTPVWGKTSGRTLLDGYQGRIREVHVNNGKVRQNTRRLAHGHHFKGLVLIGLGVGADELRSLPVGTPLSATWALDQPVRMAITGSQVLVSAGALVATDDHTNAPRTAVGLDAATGHVVIAALDGRQVGAVGATTSGWAAILLGLGVTDAVNLDGGGSTTMVARDATGTITGVVNAPSLDHERAVADALTVKYRAPR